MKTILTFFLVLISAGCFAQSTVSGKVTGADGKGLPYATVKFKDQIVLTDENGQFVITDIDSGVQYIQVGFAGLKPFTQELSLEKNKTTSINLQFTEDNEIEQVEVFGNAYAHPDKIETITRLPLDTYEQIQSISVISEELIEQQGNLTLSEAVTNVPGVYTFATYGNRSESISSRGFRGIPILKNGVRIHSDFRGTGILTDMQGVDNIQVLKGSSAITQGVATDLGSPGGVVNIVTKTPKFYQGGEVSMRTNSYGQLRPAFDVFGSLNNNKTIAYRIDGAYDYRNSYREGVEGKSIYLNPSLKFLLDENTSIVAEMDYFDDSRVPDYGTINLGSISENRIFEMPHDQFLGFDSDRSITQNTTYSFRLNRKLNNNLSVNAAFYGSTLSRDEKFADIYGTPEDEFGNPIYNQRNRYFYVTTREDDNQVVQLDLMGSDLKTGSISHTIQLGMDYRTNQFETSGYSSDLIDVVDVYEPISNVMPEIDLDPSIARGSSSKSRSTGVMTQAVTTWNDFINSFVALRYSTIETTTSTTTDNNDTWSPVAGVIVSPFENVNVFGSYTNSAYSRSAQRLDINGEPLGNERFDQIEAGVKTNWLNNRLRLNLTLYKIKNKNINLPVYDQSMPIWVETGYYQKGGNDQRRGIEFEITGRPYENLHLLAGYAYTDAQYKYHTSYVIGSSPLNTPKHTANFYSRYEFKDQLNGLSIGAGMYYLGERPINDWSSGAITHQGIEPGVEPFINDSYTLFNAQVNYAFNNDWALQLLGNNVFDAEGYNAYRTSFINPIDPSTFAATVRYTF